MSTETLTVKPYSFEWDQIFLDEEFRDSVGAPFVSGRNGNRWLLTLTFNNRTGDLRRSLWGHIFELRGKRNRLRVPLSLIDYVRGGAGGGTPLLSSAQNAGATSLPIDGATSVSNWLKSGDFISIGNELKAVTGSVTTSAGAGTIKIWPELHNNQANNAAVDIVTPHGDFFLIDSQGIGGVPNPDDWLDPTVTLVLEEDVTA